MVTENLLYVITDKARLHIAKHILPLFSPSEASELREMGRKLETLLGSEPVHPELSKLIKERESKITIAHSLLWKLRKNKGLNYHSDEDLKIYHSAVEKAFDEFFNSYVPIKALE